MITARVYHPKGAGTVLAKLKRMYGTPQKPPQTDTIEQIVLAILAYNEPLDKAQAILQRFKGYYVDFNELRATQPGELATHMGPSPAQNTAKARRILFVLKSIFNLENTFDLKFLQSKSKQELERYFSQIQGTDGYLLASVILHCCNRQAFPLDEKMLAACKELGLAGAEVNLETMQAYLERQLRSADTYAFCHLLKRYSCREPTKIERAKKKTKRKTSTKKKKKAKTTKAKTKRTSRTKSSAPKKSRRAKLKK